MATKRCNKCGYFFRVSDESQEALSLCDPCLRRACGAANAAPALGYPGGVVKLDYSPPVLLEPGGVVFLDEPVTPAHKLTPARALLLGGTVCAFFIILAGVLVSLGMSNPIAVLLSLVGYFTTLHAVKKYYSL